MKTILYLLFISGTSSALGQCSASELYDKENKLDYVQFMHYLDSANCEGKYTAYFRAKALFVNNRIKECKALIRKVVNEQEATKESVIFESHIANLCHLMMEESRSLKNKEEFEFWKRQAMRLRDPYCGTGRVEKVKLTYALCHQRYKLLNNSKQVKKYHRKLHRNYAVTKRFFNY